MIIPKKKLETVRRYTTPVEKVFSGNIKTGTTFEKVIKKKEKRPLVFRKFKNQWVIFKYDKNMPEKYKKRIKTIEKIEQNDIIKTIVRTIGGKL